jgi:type I restriction enzyme R subunit
MSSGVRTNFAFLQAKNDQAARLGMLAEKYFADDPNTCLLKLRQFAELLAQLVASRAGFFASPEEPQYELLRRLKFQGVLPLQVPECFDEIRRTGNQANHALADDQRAALDCLRISWQLGLWYHRTFFDPKYKSGPFVPPSSPKDESAELKAELARMATELSVFQKAHDADESRLQAVQTALAEAADEKGFWEQMAADAENARVELTKQLGALQAVAATASPQATIQLQHRAQDAAEMLHLDEAETRKLIDEQMRHVGWEVDSVASRNVLSNFS